MTIQPQSVDWSQYAEVYDLILTYNTAYQGIIADFEAVTCRWQPAPGQMLLDVGAGTGNFGLRIAERFPQCEVLLLDRDVSMLKQAQSKADAAGLRNVRYVQGDVAQVQDLNSQWPGGRASRGAFALYATEPGCGTSGIARGVPAGRTGLHLRSRAGYATRGLGLVPVA